MPTATFIQGDLERLDDRLAHAQQYLEEALAAVQESNMLAARIDEVADGSVDPTTEAAIEMKEVLVGMRELLAENVPLSPKMTSNMLKTLSAYLTAMEVRLGKLENAA
jgi:hypothetical protein